MDINSQKCRTCLAQGRRLTPLSTLSKASGNKLHMSDVFMMCAAIQISPNDGFSQHACTECVTLAEKAYLFKKRCEFSDKVWNEFRRRLAQEMILNPVENSEITVEIPTPVKIVYEPDEYQLDSDSMIETGSGKIDDEMDNDLDIKAIEIHEEIKRESFICKYCCTILTDEAKHSRHELSHTIEPKKLVVKKYAIYGCRDCSVDCKTAEEFIEHCHKLHENYIEKLYYRCNLCAGDFPHLPRFTAHVSKRHKILHSSQFSNVLKKFECHVCHNEYKTRDSLWHHIRRHHPGAQLPKSPGWPQSCKYCTYSLKSRKDRLTHLDQEHSDLKIFSCDKCEKTFLEEHHLKLHAGTHDKIKRHMCQYCGRSFACSSNLKTHIRIHTGEKPFKCDKCDACFAQWASLYAHKLNHVQEKNFECKECHKRFLRPGTLRVHMVTHTAGPKYPCHLCPQQLKNSKSLKRHLLVHSGARFCVCKVCGKGFNSRSNLHQHMVTHTGEKRHICTICKKGFSQAHCLRSHNAKFHMDGPS